MDWIKMFQEFGLIGLIVGVLFFILWRMLCWVMAFIKDTTKQHNEERINWNNTFNNILTKHNDTLAKISEGIDRHDERADERGKYVRSEHEKMMKNLEEQGKILARINGFKE